MYKQITKEEEDTIFKQSNTTWMFQGTKNNPEKKHPEPTLDEQIFQTTQPMTDPWEERYIYVYMFLIFW